MCVVAFICYRLRAQAHVCVRDIYVKIYLG